MTRSVSSHLEIAVHTPATLVFSVTVAGVYQACASEDLVLSLDGNTLTAAELDDVHGTRLHRVDCPAGNLSVDYSATIAGDAIKLATEERELIRYLRPSRYCESDILLPTAEAEFSGLSSAELLHAVSSWVGTELSYVPGSSGPTDGAVQTLLKRQGVCRDYAHLTIALLRALDIPARLASVYAPGLDPMDFHAVAEAYVDDIWRVVDATALAPRQSLVRIATGRDASDTAFLTSFGGDIALNSMEVTAVADSLPTDDVQDLALIR